MKIVYRKPEVEKVELSTLSTGDFFKICGGNSLFLKLDTHGNSVQCFDTSDHSICSLYDNMLVEPYRDVEIVITTPSRSELIDESE